jgi:aminoglycoside phosphotransferase (APT) family kinase protein
MKYEPAIKREHLVGTIYQGYGLRIEELTFIPVGFAAACYALRDMTGSRYFLKLWPDTSTGGTGAAQRDGMLHLVRALHDRGLYRRVPYPLATKHGALWAPFGNASFALFPFLSGHTPPFPWSEALRDEWARTIASIHCATPVLADVLPPRETLDIAFEADLRRGLAAVEQIGAHERWGLRALRDAVLPHRAEVLAQLTQLHDLQPIVRRLSGPFVLCHTDMGGDNMLVDEHGQLSVLDWDEARVAPPEHDLQEARGGGFERFLHVYKAAGGAQPLHLDHFAFYLRRRHLGDMTVRMLQILEHNATAEQDAHALDGIEAWGFGQWRALDETLHSVATALHLVQVRCTH